MLFDMLKAAGPLFWLLILLSLYSLYLFVLRWQQLHKLENPSRMLAETHTALMHQDVPGALEKTKASSCPAAQIVRCGLEHSNLGTEAVVAAMRDAQFVEDQHLFRGIDTLGTLAQIAPLLGLLGTVFGMIRSFIVFSGTATPTANQLATGISEALINTAGGLVVAILSYVFRNLLRKKAERIATYGDRVLEMLPAWLREAQLRAEGKVKGAPVTLGLQIQDTRTRITSQKVKV